MNLRCQSYHFCSHLMTMRELFEIGANLKDMEVKSWKYFCLIKQPQFQRENICHWLMSSQPPRRTIFYGDARSVMSLGLQKLARTSAISTYHWKLQRKSILSFPRKEMFSETKFFFLIYYTKKVCPLSTERECPTTSRD